MTIHLRCITCLLAVAVLNACGGGGAEAGPTAGVSAPTDNRVTLSQYAASRTNAGASVHAVAQRASDYLFATSPLAQEFSDSFPNAVIVPALHLNRRALLMAAAQGATLAELEAQSADPLGLAAGMVQRELKAAPGTLLLPAYLQTTDRGSAHAQAPQSWQVTAVTDWSTVVRVPAGSLPPTLVVNDSMSLRATWPGAVERFEGLFESDAGTRTLKPMLRIKGSVFELDEGGFSARGLQLGDGLQLLSLVPTRSSLSTFVKSELGEALLLVNQRLRAGVSRGEGAWVIAQGGAQLRELNAVQDFALAGDPRKAQLLGLDGRPQVADGSSFAGGMNWDDAGMSLVGSHSLVFYPLAVSDSSTTTGGDFTGITVPYVTPVPCPSGAADLRPMVLLLLDAQGRLMALASVADQGEAGTPCQP